MSDGLSDLSGFKCELRAALISARQSWQASPYHQLPGWRNTASGKHLKAALAAVDDTSVTQLAAEGHDDLHARLAALL